MSNQSLLSRRMSQLAKILRDNADEVHRLVCNSGMRSSPMAQQMRVFGEWMLHLSVETTAEMQRIEAKDCPVKVE